MTTYGGMMEKLQALSTSALDDEDSAAYTF
jgi:hypothetical protein